MVGVFGGSGFYKFLDKVKEVKVKTEFGEPSDKIFIGEYKGKEVAFLPRHSSSHRFPPHKIPYKANIAAFKRLGVKQIIAPCASGSLQPDIKPGDFVICNQFVNFTQGRDDTFFHGKQQSNETMKQWNRVVHISSAEPYCSYLNNLIFEVCKNLGISVHKDKTVVVINGPRFSTKGESRFFSKQGWDVINMTQYPEVVLAREAEICYATVALITDYDAGLEGQPQIKPVSLEEVIKVFQENNEKIKRVLFEVIEKIDENRDCSCQKALEGAVIN
jgi:5'-methylthioadenosine phosphorylase